MRDDVRDIKFIFTYDHYDYHNDDVKYNDVIRDVSGLSCVEAARILENLLYHCGNYRGEFLKIIEKYYPLFDKGFFDDIKPIGKTIYLSDHNMIRSVSPQDVNCPSFSGLYNDRLQCFIEIEKPKFVQDAILKHEKKLKRNKEQAQKQKIERAKRALEKQGFKVTKA